MSKGINSERCELIFKSQSARLQNRERYFETLRKYNIENGLLYRIPIDKLKELVEELEGGDA